MYEKSASATPRANNPVADINKTVQNTLNASGDKGTQVNVTA